MPLEKRDPRHRRGGGRREGDQRERASIDQQTAGEQPEQADERHDRRPVCRRATGRRSGSGSPRRQDVRARGSRATKNPLANHCPPTMRLNRTKPAMAATGIHRDRHDLRHRAPANVWLAAPRARHRAGQRNHRHRPGFITSETGQRERRRLSAARSLRSQAFRSRRARDPTTRRPRTTRRASPRRAASTRASAARSSACSAGRAGSD